jgi:hypothetical protein
LKLGTRGDDVLAYKSIDRAGASFTVAITAGQQFKGDEFRLNPESKQPLELVQVLIKKGADAGMTWKISVARKDAADAVQVTSGTTETDVIYQPTRPVYLAPGDYLKIESTGATSAMKASVVFSLPSSQL